METSGTNMITATREYQRGSAHLQVQVMTGGAAQGALAATRTGMNIETSDGRMNTSTIDGLQVTRSFNNKDQSGAILGRAWHQRAVQRFVQGNRLRRRAEPRQKFDWKAIQAAAQAK